MKTPLSLPPIVIVTSWVPAASAFELRRDPGVLGFEEVARLRRPAGDVLQLAPVARAMSCG